MTELTLFLGWGDVNKLKSIFRTRKVVSNRNQCNLMVRPDHPVNVGPVIETTSSYSLFEGHFSSPMINFIGDFIPPEAHTSRFQMILPKTWTQPIKPICIHLAGTGDHFFGRRRILMAKPLLKEYGIGSIILENPFYGTRKPVDQKRSSLRNVSDIFVMGGCLILETIALLNWLRREGFGPLGVTGISMGGHNAALAGTSWNQPCSIIPCLSWTTASRSFTEGVLRESVPWDVLESEIQSFDDKCMTELCQLIHSPEFDTNNALFRAGKQFVKDYPSFCHENEYLLTHQEEQLQQMPEKKSKKADTINFMRGIMDECTHLGNFSCPVDPSLAFVVTASRDGYVPQSGSIPLTDLWPGCTHVNIKDHGHVSAILFKGDVFRKAIADSMDLNARKYYGISLFRQEKQEKQES